MPGTDRTLRASRNARPGARRRPAPARRARRPGRLVVGVLIALLVTGAAVYVGLDRRSAGPHDPRPSGSATPRTTSSGRPTASASPPAASPSADLGALSIARQPFCDQLPTDDVEAALGAPVASTYHYDDGQRRRITPTLTDVAHEYNCTFTAADGTQARAWVFAAPVSRRSAVSLVRDASRTPGCGPLAHAPVFGRPTVATVCREHRPDTVAATLSGLFGDAWLSCQVSTPGRGGSAATSHRAEQWCVRVATTLGSAS